MLRVGQRFHLLSMHTHALGVVLQIYSPEESSSSSSRSRTHSEAHSHPQFLSDANLDGRIFEENMLGIKLAKKSSVVYDNQMGASAAGA